MSRRNGLGKMGGRIGGLGVALQLLVVLAMCWPQLAGAQDHSPRRSVILQLPWLHQFQFAGYYAALEQGYYEEAGFDVSIRGGRPGISAVDEVVHGRAQYGVARGEMLLHYLKGEPVMALAAIFQHSAVIFLARQDSGITSPQDMVGRKVMLLPGDDSAEYIATFRNEGVDLARLEIIPSTFDVADLVSGKTDVFNGYSTNEPFFLQEQGIAASIIKPSTYGIDFYGDTLFTSEVEEARYPDQVRAFRAASLRGWQYALEHKEEIIALLKDKYGVERSLAHLRFEANAIEELIKADLVEIGHMNQGRWQHMADTYVHLGMAKPGYDLAHFIYDADPRPDYSRIILSFYLLLAVFVGTAVVLLLLFNRRLNKVLSQRTTALQNTERALAKSEELYRIIFDKTPVGIGLIAMDGSISELNNKALEISGYTREEALRRNVVDLYQDPKDRKALISRVVKNGFVSGIMCKLKRKDGTPFDGRFTCVVLELDGEHKMLSMLEDVTKEREIEREKAKINSALQRMQKMEAIGLMAGGVAHDLNNILSGIVSYPELILMQLPEDSPWRRSVVEIHKSGQRAAAVVADLLTVARGVASVKKPHNVNGLILEYLDSPEYQQLEMLHGNVICSMDLNPELANICCSPVHIKKCFMNLVTNAAEAIKGQGCVTISTRNERVESGGKNGRGLGPGNYVVVSVADTGPGISEEDKEHIFEPFYSKKVMGRSGTGLGLAVVWNAVQDHNGVIHLQSSDKGTVFELYFPACLDRAGCEIEEGGAIQQIEGHGESVLIIDDEPQQRDIACQMLTSLGYQPHAVSSGEEALAYLADHQAELLLLDMLMAPGINGRQTYEEIIKDHPGQKAVICSGFSKNDEVKRTHELGAGGFLKKPYTRNQLGMAVQQELTR